MALANVAVMSERVQNMNVGDTVETIKGAGVIQEILDHRVHGGDITYLISLGQSGFPSDSDIFAEDEITENS